MCLIGCNTWSRFSYGFLQTLLLFAWEYKHNSAVLHLVTDNLKKKFKFADTSCLVSTIDLKTTL